MKKFLYIGIACIVAIGLFLLFQDPSADSRPQTDEEQPSPGNEKPSGDEEDGKADDTGSTYVNQVIKQSKQGKVPGSSVKAGITKMKTVKGKLGEPEQSSRTSSGRYGSYPDQDLTFGYSDGLVFDVRYAGPALKDIHLQAIKATQGEPDEKRFYKDDAHDQVILVYQVNETYQLKWVLPKPSEESKNPAVDHVSVWTKLESSVSKDVSKMTLDEKIGQMIIAGFSGTTLTKKTKDLIQRKKIGGMIFYDNNLTSPKQTIQLVNQMKAANKQNKLPLFLSVDQEGGKVSRLPGNLRGLPTNQAIGKVNNPSFSNAVGKLLGDEVKEYGFNLDFAPVMDVNSNPNNPVIGDRSFSSDPNVAGKLGVQTMKGMQSAGVIPVIKHFPGHGDTSIDSHLQLPRVDKTLEELQNLELIPFKKAINKGTDIVMTAHILLPELDETMPASMSHQVITELLRNQLGYDGVVMTDDMTMKAVTNNFGIEQAALDAVNAGSDMLLIAHDTDKAAAVINTLKAAVEKGQISEERINRSVERIINLKEKYQLNNRKRDKVDVNQLNQSIQNVLDRYMD